MEEEVGGVTLAVALVPVGTGVAEAVDVSVVAAADGAEGVASIVLERGKPVQARRRDLKGLTQHGTVDPDSNYCFGEGGAGTYSDGKLYTRSHCTRRRRMGG